MFKCEYKEKGFKVLGHSANIMLLGWIIAKLTEEMKRNEVNLLKNSTQRPSILHVLICFIFRLSQGETDI